MDALGKTLRQEFNEQGSKFPMKTVLTIADQMINRLEYIHSRGFIHRSVSPDVFATGLGLRSHRIFIFEFGFARKFMWSTGKHITLRQGKLPFLRLVDQQFTSINADKGMTMSRRDDMEALAYVLLYFLRGSLPWKNM